jgi:hypothetical protein
MLFYCLLVGTETPSMKKNTLLATAIVIPVLMMVVTGIGVLMTTRNLTSTQDFLYSVAEINNPYYCVEQIRNAIVPTLPAPRPLPPNVYRAACPPVKLYVYDFKTDKSKEVSLTQAQHFVFGNPNRSSDGFTIVNYCSDKRMVLGVGDFQEHFRSFCLMKGGYKRSLNPHPNDDSPHVRYVNFITWLQGDAK